jgi:hypothetical protein
MDIVERLREGKSAGGYWREKEAADEIERLREQAHYHYENGLKKDVEIDRLREALRTIRDGARDVEKSYADLQQKDKDSE